jgi:hypothetical protein
MTEFARHGAARFEAALSCGGKMFREERALEGGAAFRKNGGINAIDYYFLVLCSAQYPAKEQAGFFAELNRNTGDNHVK